MDNTNNVLFFEEREKMERSFLSSLLLQPTFIAETNSMVRPEMFSNPNLGFVYGAMEGLFNQGKQVDLILLEFEMKQRDLERFRSMGGLVSLYDGIEEYRLSGNILEYAEEIKRYYMLGALINIFTHKVLESSQFGADYLSVISDCTSQMDRLLSENREADTLVPLVQLAEASIHFQEERMRKKDDPRMIRTGIYHLDGIIGGLYRREVLTIGGQTSDGKTALSMYIAMNAARKGRQVLHFSFEMTGDQTVERYFTAHARVEADRLRIGGLRQEDLAKMKKYAEEIKTLPYYFVNDATMTLDAMRAEIMMRSRRGECDVVLVDYLHGMLRDDGKSNSLEGQVRRIATELKRIAEKANCALLLVSQLNREHVKRNEKWYIPQTSDLRDSGAIDYVSDTVLIISRPERFGLKRDDEGYDTARLLQLYVLKNRNGPVGVTRVYHNGTFSNFHEPGANLHFED